MPPRGRDSNEFGRSRSRRPGRRSRDTWLEETSRQTKSYDRTAAAGSGFEYYSPPAMRRGRDLARRKRRREPWDPGWGEPAYMPPPASGGRWRFYVLALALAILALGAALTAIRFFLPDLWVYEDKAVVLLEAGQGAHGDTLGRESQWSKAICIPTS